METAHFPSTRVRDVLLGRAGSSSVLWPLDGGRWWLQGTLDLHPPWHLASWLQQGSGPLRLSKSLLGPGDGHEDGRWNSLFSTHVYVRLYEALGPGLVLGCQDPQQSDGSRQVLREVLSLSCDNPGQEVSCSAYTWWEWGWGVLLLCHPRRHRAPAPARPGCRPLPGPAVQRRPCPCHRTTPSPKGVGSKSLTGGPWVTEAQPHSGKRRGHLKGIVGPETVAICCSPVLASMRM